MKPSANFDSLFTAFTVPVSAYATGNIKLNHEEFHELRVAIKNIRAILELSESFTNKDIKSRFEPVLGPVFKHAGKIRVTEINLQHLKPFKNKFINPVKAQLIKDRRLATQRYYQESRLFNKKQFHMLSGELLSGFNNFPKKKLRLKSEKFLNKKLKRVEELLKENKNNKSLHEARKELKMVKTVLHILLPMFPGKQFSKNLKKVTFAESLIGDWHDKAGLQSYITKFIQKSNNRNSLLRDFNKTLKGEVRTERKEICKNILKTIDF